jgi:hypothetical protein
MDGVAEGVTEGVADAFANVSDGPVMGEPAVRVFGTLER